MSQSTKNLPPGLDKQTRALWRAYRAQDWPTFAQQFKTQFNRLCASSVDWCMAQNGQLESMETDTRSTSVVIYFHDCIARDLEDILSLFYAPTVIDDIWYGSETSTRAIVLGHRFGVASLEVNYPEYSDDESDGSGIFRLVFCHPDDCADFIADLSRKALHSAGTVVGGVVPHHLKEAWLEGFCGALSCDLAGVLLFADAVMTRLTQRLDEELRKVAPGSEMLLGNTTLLHGGLSSSARRRIARELDALARLAEQTGMQCHDYCTLNKAFQRYVALSRYMTNKHSDEVTHGN